MIKTRVGVGRIATCMKDANLQNIRSVVRRARHLYTKTHTQIRPVAKSQHQSSRAGPIALAIVGLAGGYGAWSAYQDRSGSSKSLNTSSFTPFKLVGKEKVSSTCSIFTLEQPGASGATIQDMWTKGVWSIDIKQPQLQIARSYTPLPPLDSRAPESQLRLLVRKERKGEMSNYIHSTPLNGTLELRGPAVEHELPQEVNQVVFLAGGTGIAPAIQIAHTLRESGSVSVLWANRKREDCEGGHSDTLKASTEWWFSALAKRLGTSPQSQSRVDDGRSSGHAVVHQLDQMKKAGKTPFRVDYFVDEEGTFIRPQDVNAVLSRETSMPAPSSGEKLIFVSGPDGFLNYWAGPKVWSDGREVQGPLGGALSRMNLEGWKVVKL